MRRITLEEAFKTIEGLEGVNSAVPQERAVAAKLLVPLTLVKPLVVDSYI